MPELNFDLVVIGGGPSGLAAAINATSEGLKTLLIDSKDQLGGQASASAAIENYPGFPEGITGKELMSRFINQANRFKTDFLRPVVVTGITNRDDANIIHENDMKIVTTNDERLERISCQAVILALGLSYRRLQAKGVANLLGMGISYGMPVVDSYAEGQCFCVVGGANSAGQAAVHLSKIKGCKVKMLIRGETLKTDMSRYLMDDIQAIKNIEILHQTEVIEAMGDTRLRSIIVKQGDKTFSMKADGLYIFIGASPKTFWLNGAVEKSDRGYILTGRHLTSWAGDKRQPLAFETSMPGVFSCGDVRDGSTKRIASAVGEGSVAVQQLHAYLAALRG